MREYHVQKVRSAAKNTFGSMRTGKAIRFPGACCRSGCDDIIVEWRLSVLLLSRWNDMNVICSGARVPRELG